MKKITSIKTLTVILTRKRTLEFLSTGQLAMVRGKKLTLKCKDGPQSPDIRYIFMTAFADTNYILQIPSTIAISSSMRQETLILLILIEPEIIS